jgi:hypothetical protein
MEVNQMTTQMPRKDLQTTPTHKRNSSKKKVVPKDESIIIPSIPNAYCFKRNCYSYDILGSRLSKEEFDTIINKASIILGNTLLKKRSNDSFKIPLHTKVLILISIICLVLYVIFFFACEAAEKGGTVLFVFSLIFIIGSMGITLYQSYSNFFRPTRQYKTVSELIKEDITEYLNEVNAKLDGKDNNYITFKLHENDRSIECIVLQN